MPINPDDVPKTAIITPFGLFEFVYMTFGLRNAAQTFQRLINQTMQGLDFVFAYIDDICIASTNIEEHKRHIEIVFERLRKCGLNINIAKCEFGKDNLTFLGHLITKEGLKPLPSKVDAIKDFKLPTQAKDLKRFLAMTNFYRRFIPNAVIHQTPLQALIKGNKRNDKSIINWTNEASQAFEECKKDIETAVMLAYPIIDAQLSLSVDASDFAVGAVLHQLINNSIQPIAFYSKKLTDTQKKYSTYDRELTAIFQAVKHFKHLLEGREFYILTDHKPLRFSPKIRKSSTKTS